MLTTYFNEHSKPVFTDCLYHLTFSILFHWPVVMYSLSDTMTTSKTCHSIHNISTNKHICANQALANKQSCWYTQVEGQDSSIQTCLVIELMRWTFDFSSSISSARHDFSSLNFLFCCSFLAAHRHHGNIPAKTFSTAAFLVEWQ